MKEFKSHNNGKHKLLKNILFLVFIIMVIIVSIWTVIKTGVFEKKIILFQDDFATESGRWEKNGPWKIDNGKFQIDISGKDLPWAAAFVYPLGDLTEWDNFSLELDQVCKMGSYSYINFRQTEKGSYFLAFNWDTTPKFITLKKSGGSGNIDKSLRSPEFNLEYDRLYHIKITAIENNFKVFMDNNLVIDVTDKENPYLYGGIVLSIDQETGEGFCTFDNVKIYQE